MTESLRSTRLILRRLTLDDAAHFARLLENDSESVQMMARVPDPCTEEGARNYIEMRTSPGSYTFAITRADDGEFMGSIGVSGPLDRLGLGYWIGRPFWGKGYATEAVWLIIGFARELGATQMLAETYPNNPASARVLDKTGFENVGLAVIDLPMRGGLREVCQYVLKLNSE